LCFWLAHKIASQNTGVTTVFPIAFSTPHVVTLRVTALHT
jgi:hypothetical protein